MFINTLPIIFGHSQLFGPVDLLVAMSILFALLYFTAPVPGENPLAAASDSGSGLYQYLYQAWWGELPLGIVLWPFFMILNGSLYAADTMVKDAVISVSSWENIHLILATPVLWWTIAVWRATEHSFYRLWSAGARWLVLSVYFEFALRVLIFQQYPRIFFNCEGAVMNYFSCF